MTLSIVTINYNNIDGLQKTIKSVLEQSYADYEWIIIDGGSSDGSKELLEDLNQKTSNINYWCSEPDKGVYNAMNKGIEHCSGHYISFLNSGDTYHSKLTLEKVFTNKPTDDIIYGDWVNIYPDHEVRCHYHPPVTLKSLYENNICHQAMFIRTQILKDEGYDETYKMLADHHRWIKAAMQGASFCYIDTIVCDYDMLGMTSSSSAILTEEGQRIRKLFPPTLISLFEQIYYYENYHHFIKVKRLVKGGGIKAFITKVFLKIM